MNFETENSSELPLDVLARAAKALYSTLNFIEREFPTVLNRRLLCFKSYRKIFHAVGLSEPSSSAAYPLLLPHGTRI
jgi:hypothetical protein